jgi:Pilus formation protein N terminal region
MIFRFRPERSACGLVLASVLAVGASQPALSASRDVVVAIDQAMMLRLERSAAEVVVGNPSIADVAIQDSKVLVLTGKSFGETNLIVLDAQGKVIINRRLVVAEPQSGYVTVYHGTRRETLQCSPDCETPLVIGDDPGYFESLSKEIRTKQAIGQSSAEGEKQSE